MGLTRRIVGIVAAVTAALAMFPAAAAPFAADGGTENAQLNMPADGTGASSTDQLPQKVTQADVTVTPPLSDEEFFGHLRAVLAGPYHDAFPDRALHCVVMTEDLSKDSNYFPGYQIQGKALQIMFLQACIELALDVTVNGKAHAQSASGGCYLRPEVAALKTTRTSTGYVMSVSPATPTTQKAKTTVNLSCRRTAAGMKLQIRPRRRGQKLRSTIGSKLAIGIVNPTTQAIPLKIAFTAR